MIRIITSIISNNNWQFSQAINIICYSLLGFFSMIMAVENKSDHYIWGTLSIFYVIKFLAFLLVKEQNIKNGKATILFLISFFQIFFIFYIFTNNYNYIFVSMIFIFVLQDLIMVNLFNDIKTISKKNQYREQEVIAVSLIIVIIISAIFKPLMGFILDENIKYGLFVLFCFSFLILFFALFKNSIKISILENNIGKTPNIIYLHCILSFFYNSISFFCSFFILPLFIIEISNKTNYPIGSFSILGIVLGVAALLTFSTKSLKISNSKNITMINYFIGIVCWNLLLLSYYLYNKDIIVNNLFAILLSIIPFLTVQVTSRLWSAGFLEQISMLSNKEQSEESNIIHKRALSIFFALKSLGGFFVFFIVFLTHNLFDYYYIILSISFISIIYGFCYLSYRKKIDN